MTLKLKITNQLVRITDSNPRKSETPNTERNKDVLTIKMLDAIIFISGGNFSVLRVIVSLSLRLLCCSYEILSRNRRFSLLLHHLQKEEVCFSSNRKSRQLIAPSQSHPTISSFGFKTTLSLRLSDSGR